MTNTEIVFLYSRMEWVSVLIQHLFSLYKDILTDTQIFFIVLNKIIYFGFSNDPMVHVVFVAEKVKIKHNSWVWFSTFFCSYAQVYLVCSISSFLASWNETDVCAWDSSGGMCLKTIDICWIDLPSFFIL